MYSQNNEETYILEFFSNLDYGKLLDIGAYDGKTFSNSRALLEKGWQGTLVEPDPRNLCDLIINCNGLDVDILAAAISTYSGIAALRIELTKDRYWASSISSSTDILNEAKITYHVPCIGINDLLKIDYNFITIDTEHMDFEILKAINTNRPFCDMLCVEPKNEIERKDMKKYLASIGYKVYHETRENLVCISGTI